MAIVCGQDLSTLDVVLLERCICLTAYKNDYTNDEVDRYKELKDMEENGFEIWDQGNYRAAEIYREQ